MSTRKTPASLLLALERFDESKAEFAKLLEANADNYEYHTGLQCAHCKIVEKRENPRSTAKAVVTYACPKPRETGLSSLPCN